MRDMHATAEILAGKLEKRERKNTRKVIVVKKEITEGEIRRTTEQKSRMMGRMGVQGELR